MHTKHEIRFISDSNVSEIDDAIFLSLPDQDKGSIEAENPFDSSCVTFMCENTPQKAFKLKKRRSFSSDIDNQPRNTVERPKSLGKLEALKLVKEAQDNISSMDAAGRKTQSTPKNGLVSSGDWPIPFISPLCEKHPCLDALSRYHQSSLPVRGQSMEFSVSQYLNPIQFRRPYFDEEEELYAEWGLPLTFFNLSFKNVMTLVSAVLLERRIVVRCSNLRYLSSLVMSIPPLIRPFLYQSVLIPMLPLKMPSLLDAPVPYLIGVTQLTAEMCLPDDVILLDLQDDIIRSSEPIPLLPKSTELERKCQLYHKELLASFKKHEAPFSTSREQLRLVENISTIFEAHLGSLFANFDSYTICNKNDPAHPVTVFMKESFLEDLPSSERQFIEPFFDTQMFFQFSDSKLRQRDRVFVKDHTFPSFSG